MDLPLDRLNYLADITRKSSGNILVFGQAGGRGTISRGAISI
jgi:hypothetical protein